MLVYDYRRETVEYVLCGPDPAGVNTQRELYSLKQEFLAAFPLVPVRGNKSAFVAWLRAEKGFRDVTNWEAL